MATAPLPAVPAAGPRPRRRLPLAALGLLAGLAAFGAGVVHLFHLRFDAGDVYPPYSTLRSDPLGAKVFYESLQSLPGLSAERSLRPLPLLGVPVMSRPEADHGEAGDVCFYLGADPEQWPYLLPGDDARRLERIAERGGRVVVTFQPTTHAPTGEALDHARDTRQQPDPKKGQRNAERKDGKDDEDQDDDSDGKPSRQSKFAPVDLAADWQIDFRRAPAPATGTGQGKSGAPPPAKTPAATEDAAALARKGQARPVRPAGAPPPAPGDGETPVAWHTAVDFQLDPPATRRAGWRALYTRAGHPVVVARPWGQAGGELVLVSDTYFLSNEGLHEAAHPDLLAALVGRGRRVIFDESHFGITDHPGIMTLARRYRLQGALAALGLLAGLFVWRNAVSLLPPRTADPGAAGDAMPVTGRDAAAGFFNLLRRGVAPAELPALCLAQWRQHLSPATGPAADSRQLASPANVERLQAALAAPGRPSPAALYRAMCAALKR